MELNAQSKKELKEKIGELLEEVPEGQRIQLDKDLLEDLLFDTVTLNKEKDIKVKLPVWWGKILKKIDLSQVDYTNVSWSLSSLNQYFFEDEFEDFIRSGLEVDKEAFFSILENKEYDTNRAYCIDYTGTNARIDLSKSFDAIHFKKIVMHNLDFTGHDFSQQDLTGIKWIWLVESSLKDTNLPIGNIDLSACYSDLSGLDLSNIKIDGVQYLMGDHDNLGHCDLTDSGVQIVYNEENLNEYIKESSYASYQEDLTEAMNKNWIGCYLNGEKVLSPEERQRVEYENYKQQIFDSVSSSIEEQIRHMK